MGPTQVATSPWNLVTGEVTSIAADPSDTSGNTVYLGTAGGGVWKSTSAAGGVSSVAFAPLTEPLPAFSSAALSSLSIGAVSVQPGGANVILAGTGDPNNASSSWYGVGILRSADGGNSWALISGTVPAPGGASGAFNFVGNAFAGFAWSSATSGLVIAAVTNSGYGSILGAGNSQSVPGLYYSYDAGVTWQLATIEDGATVIQSPQTNIASGNSATAVVWNPLRRQFYAAIRFHGYYQSNDGITWTRLASQPGTGLTLDACPTNSTLSGSPACPIFRGALAVQPVTGDMFALTVDVNNLDQGLWQDLCALNAGACTQPVQFGIPISDQSLQSTSGDGSIPDASYDLWLAVVPSQQDTLLFVGATDIWRCSLANSCLWRNTTHSQTCSAAGVAPSQHAVDATFGATGLIYFGNDGGLWRTTDSVNQQEAQCLPDDAAHFQNLNGALGSLAQVESFSESPDASSTWLAALGPLGTAATSGNAVWNQVLDGEGDFVAIDSANPQNWYATSEFGVGINRCAEGTACNTTAFGNTVIGEAQVSGDLQTIPAPWILDPQNTASLILGTCRVWRGPANGEGWTPASLLSGMLDQNQGSSCQGNAEIRSLAAGINSAASGDPGAEQLYTGMAGSLDGGGLVPGHLFAASVDNASQASTVTWNDRYASPVTNQPALPQFNPNGQAVSGIFADPHDPTGQTIYVTLDGVPADSASPAPIVYSSTDAGAHWTNITSNLPQAPANSILVDPNNANIVYVALDTGVYIAQNVAACAVPGTPCWNVYGNGLPSAPVVSLMTYSQGSGQWLRAATWGRGIWQLPLATAGTIVTQASLSPASLTFASQQVQTLSPPQTVTVTNTGSVVLSIASISVSGDFSETDTCAGGSIPPAGSCPITVTFDPSQTGSRTGTITVFANVAGGQLSLPLSGTGLPPAAVVLNPSSLTFPATAVGTTSPEQAVTIQNASQQWVDLTGQSLVGDFAVAYNACGTGLQPQTSCTLQLVFAPKQSGSRTGTFTVIDSLGTQTAQLAGIGQTLATDTLAPLSLTFPAQAVGSSSSPQLITLSNTGDQTLTRISVSASTADFSVESTCGASLQGHATCALAVTWIPSNIGAENASLSVTDEFRTTVIPLSGTGIAPPGVSAIPSAINFGGLLIGATSAPSAVTVTNNTGAALLNLTTAITPGFAIATNTCPASLAAGATCQIGVTFTAAAAGPVTGTLTLAAPGLAKSPVVTLAGAGQDFSMAVSGPSSAIITAGQTATFSLQLSGLDGTSGTVALACSGAPKNATCSLNPAAVAVSGLNTSSVTVTIATTASTAAATPWPAGLPPLPWHAALPAAAIALPLGCLGLRRRKAALVLLVSLGIALLPVACGVSASSGAAAGSGSSGGSQGASSSGTYAVTVTGTMSGITHSVGLSLTVQ